jgi:hypothetical protein
VLYLLLEEFALMVFGIAGFVLSRRKYRFDFFDSPRHAHILIQDLETFHES